MFFFFLVSFYSHSHLLSMKQSREDGERLPACALSVERHSDNANSTISPSYSKPPLYHFWHNLSVYIDSVLSFTSQTVYLTFHFSLHNLNIWLACLVHGGARLQFSFLFFCRKPPSIFIVSLTIQRPINAVDFSFQASCLSLHLIILGRRLHLYGSVPFVHSCQ